MPITKEQLKAATPKTGSEVVAVPGWGPVTVRGLTGAEYDRFEAVCRGGALDWQTDRGLLARLAVVDEAVAHVFGDEDLGYLRDEVPVAVLGPIARAALRLTGVAGGN